MKNKGFEEKNLNYHMIVRNCKKKKKPRVFILAGSVRWEKRYDKS